ncbi:MAG: hypothetical protein CVV32_04595 [Methanomicrobiales archaeon HGW-Methanomicrobiales-3]|jgi:hypothetical protein|nr:MAG: hypothetical protein CVV32_04595 [Methanomicrobiales archaeon HGW-Methanomicrobiales-3]
MNLFRVHILLIALVLAIAATTGCTSSNIPTNPVDALSSGSDDEFVTSATNNLIMMTAGADNFLQLFSVYSIGTLSADDNSKKFMQQFRLDYQGIDNLMGCTYEEGRPTGRDRGEAALAKELYRYQLKSDDLQNWRGWLVSYLFGDGRTADETGVLHELHEEGHLLIDAYDRGDYPAATLHAAEFERTLRGYQSFLAARQADLRTMRS